MENTYGNETGHIRNHFQKIQSSFQKVKKLGMDRFQALRRAFNPSIKEITELVNILVKASQRFIHQESLSL